MATVGTYYLNAPSLSSATAAYTDAALTTSAPDGWYSDGAIVRELVSGVFTNIISSCAPCAVPCGTTPVNIAEGKSFLEMTQNVGGTALDVGAIVIEIDYLTFERPIGLYFEYDGVQYNTLSCQGFGLVQGPVGPNQVIYIGDVAYDCGILAAGYQPLPVKKYNPVTNVFDNTGQFLSVAALAPQIQLSPGTPGKYVMVIPKTMASPSTIDFQGRLLCNANGFNITINCPTNLPSFTSSTRYASSVDACGSGTFETYYVADVNGTTKAGGYLDYYDWVFSDSNGATVLTDGYYRSPSASNGWFEVQDGVIVAFGGGCAYPEWRIDYQVENAILGPCNVNIANLFLEISQPPFPSYVNVNAPSSGNTLVPEGLTHIQLRSYYYNTYSPCGQLKMVIERNGIIIASKTYTPTIGVYEYLDVDINLDDDASIYGYITLA
jgi:hypothetical protein